MEHGLGGLGEQSWRPLGHAHQLCEGRGMRELVRLKRGASTLGPARSGSCTSGCTAGRRFRARAASSECWRGRAHRASPNPGGAGRGRLAQGLRAEAPNEVWAWISGVVAGPERGAGRAAERAGRAQPDDFGAKSGSGRADGDSAGPLRGVVPTARAARAIRSDNGPPLPAPRGCWD